MRREMSVESIRSEQDTERSQDTERTRERLAFLSAASAQLVETLDYETMLRNVAWLAVPRIADWCAVYIVLESGRIEAVEVAHRDPARQAMARRVVRRFPVELDSPSGVGRVVRTGETEFVALVPDDPTSETSSEAPRFEASKGFGLRSTITAPLTARGVVHGAITIANSTSGRTFTRDDVALVTEFAGRAALAIENARLYRQAHEARLRAEASEARSALLAAFSETLATSLEHTETLERAVALLVPAIADWALVDLAEDNGVRRVCAAHADEASAKALSTTQAIATLPRVEWATRHAAVDIGCLESLVGAEAARVLPTKTALSLPLVVPHRLHGRLVLGRQRNRDDFSEADLEFGRQLAGRAAIALENGFLYRQATDAIRVRDNLLSIASHELKTPLTSMNLSVDLLRRLALKAPDAGLRAQVARRAESTWRQLQWLSSLVDELLDVTRINSGRLDLRRESVDLGALASEVIERFEHEFEHAGCPVSVQVQGEPSGEWDRGRLEQVLVNLLTNATKYGAGQPVEVFVQGGSPVELRVRDHGLGLDREDLERVFSAFERTAAAKDFAGLGLGLYITRHIVEAHGGTIDCESDGPGRGAAFTVRLPVRRT